MSRFTGVAELLDRDDRFVNRVCNGLTPGVMTNIIAAGLMAFAFAERGQD